MHLSDFQSDFEKFAFDSFVTLKKSEIKKLSLSRTRTLSQGEKTKQSQRVGASRK